MSPDQKKIRTLKIVWSIILAVALVLMIVGFSIPIKTEKKPILSHEGYILDQTDYVTQYEIIILPEDMDADYGEATVRFYDKDGKLLESQTSEFYVNYESMSSYISAYFYVHGEVASYEIVENAYTVEEESGWVIIGVLSVPLFVLALSFWIGTMFFVKEYHYTCGERKFSLYLGTFHHHVRVDDDVFDGNINFLTGVWQLNHKFDNGDELFVSVSGLNRISFTFNGFFYESDEELGKAAQVLTGQTQELPAIAETVESGETPETAETATRSVTLPPMSVQPPDAEIKKVRKERLTRGLVFLGMLLLGVLCIFISAFPAPGVEIAESRGYINARYEQTVGGTTTVRTEYEVDILFTEEVDGGEVTLAFYDKDGKLLDRVTDEVIWQDFEGAYIVRGEVASYKVESFTVSKLSWLLIPAIILLYFAIIIALPLFLLSLMHKTAKFEHEGKEIIVYARNSLRYVKVNGRKYYEDNTLRFGEKHIRVTLADGQIMQITCSGVNNISAKVGDTVLTAKK